MIDVTAPLGPHNEYNTPATTAHPTTTTTIAPNVPTPFPLGGDGGDGGDEFWRGGWPGAGGRAGGAGGGVDGDGGGGDGKGDGGEGGGGGPTGGPCMLFKMGSHRPS